MEMIRLAYLSQTWLFVAFFFARWGQTGVAPVAQSGAVGEAAHLAYPVTTIAGAWTLTWESRAWGQVSLHSSSLTHNRDQNTAFFFTFVIGWIEQQMIILLGFFVLSSSHFGVMRRVLEPVPASCGRRQGMSMNESPVPPKTLSALVGGGGVGTLLMGTSVVLWGCPYYQHTFNLFSNMGVGPKTMFCLFFSTMLHGAKSSINNIFFVDQNVKNE